MRYPKNGGSYGKQVTSEMDPRSFTGVYRIQIAQCRYYYLHTWIPRAFYELMQKVGCHTARCFCLGGGARH